MQKIIHVAVAVIYYQNQYLLGYRNANQHQGNRYEFIGGKIEHGETPKQGLTREVAEEIGCDLSNNCLVKMGVIRHDYGDKAVALHIFNIDVSQEQFESLQSEQGSEGQTIIWVDKADLLANKYPLPDANARILDWLTLPNTIFISQSLDKFANDNDWVNFYAKNLPTNAHFYSRSQTENKKAIQLIDELQKQRQDITPLIQCQTFLVLNLVFKNMIIHLNHEQLMTLDFADLPKNCQYFASCHDKNSLSKINDLAKIRNVLGCFVSPVLPTPTHPDVKTLGWQRFAELTKLSDVPVFALGGVGQDDLATAWQYGAVGVAGIRLIGDF
ncbi:NUDIX domain-containing protein [Faucicola mancuniensis]|uniref:NUDIX domain-containing protein n=1 Tax=Faucicola mancuniensis TaxID=1309795 RepID=UPI0039775E97